MSRKTVFTAAIAAATLLLGAGATLAAPVTTYCPGTTYTGDREFTVTIDGPPAAGCVTWAAGNTDTPAGKAQIAGFIGDSVLLDKSDKPSEVPGFKILVDGVNELSGLWRIIVPDGKVLTNVFLAFKSGNGQLDPDWALFSLPDEVLKGEWSIAAGRQSLSHVNLYGTIADAPPPPSPVPLPAAGLLLLGALGGLGALRRRRRG